MAEIVAIGLFLLLISSISYFGYRNYVRPARMYQQLGNVQAPIPSISKATPEEHPGLAVRVLMMVGEVLPIAAEDSSEVRKDLVAAGFRSDLALKIYTGIRLALTITLPIIAFFLRDYVTSIPILRAAFVVVAGVVGFFAPGFFLERLVGKRHETLRFSLPDALDLMVVSVEAGLGLDQAIQYTARELNVAYPELSEELALVNLEIRAGKRRMDALRNMAERTGEPEIRKLIAVLVQTDRFGTSVADSLRTHSDFMRVRRRQEAEERAGKVGVKLVFPIFFCILPSMLLVAAGPGLLQVFKGLFPLMNSGAGL